MNKNIMAVCLTFSLLILNGRLYAQAWEARVQTHYFYEYDYDLQKAKTTSIKKPCSFLVDISSSGTGKFVFLDDEYGDKFVYQIIRAEETNYSDGTPYVRLTTSMKGKQQSVFVEYKTNRKGYRTITKIVLFRDRENDATVFTN